MPPDPTSARPCRRRRTCAAAVLTAVLTAVLAASPAGAASVPAGPGGDAPLPEASRRPLQAPPGARGVADTTTPPRRPVEEARDAQRDFERFRRRHVPYGGGRGADRCDEHVGRYCLWHGDGGDDREPPPEPAEIRERRSRLLERLARAAARAPGSGWISGQRVRYLLEAGRGREAVSVARACGARRWWCRALEGHALHRTGRHRPADAAFDSALAGMPEDVGRRWTDMAVLLEGDARDRWEELDAGARARFARRTWRLSDPLWVVPGNERRAEHLSRRTAARIRRDAATPFGPRWDDGLEELLLRYGLWAGYERDRPSPVRLRTRPRVTGIHDPDALRFVPGARALLSPMEAGEDAWRVDDPRPRSSYAPPYADTVGRLPHVLSLFPRGDSTVVVAAYRARGDVPRTGRDAVAGLRLYAEDELGAPGAARPAARASAPGATEGVLRAAVPSRPHLLGLELLDRERRRAQRARYGVRIDRRPEGVPGLSDLLLHAPGGSRTGTLAGAAARAQGPAPLRPGDEVGLYWEVYGPGRLLRGMEVSVALTDDDGDLLRRLGGLLGLDDGGVAGLRWQGRPGKRGRTHPRSLRIRIPTDLPEGSYSFELVVELEGFDPLVARRAVTVERK